MSANSASKTHGIVSSEGPESHVYPPADTRPHFPPAASPASSTRHRVARRREPDRGRQPAHARADHDDLHRSRRHSAGPATAPIAAAPAAATRGRRHSAALANASPTHVHA